MAGIEVPKTSIAEFCRRNQIRKLALFGSVLRPDFGPESDVLCLVRSIQPMFSFFQRSSPRRRIHRSGKGLGEQSCDPNTKSFAPTSECDFDPTSHVVQVSSAMMPPFGATPAQSGRQITHGVMALTASTRASRMGPGHITLSKGSPQNLGDRRNQLRQSLLRRRNATRKNEGTRYLPSVKCKYGGKGLRR